MQLRVIKRYKNKIVILLIDYRRQKQPILVHTFLTVINQQKIF